MNAEARPFSPAELTEQASGAPLFNGKNSLPFLGKLKVQLSARLGQTEISVSDLAALQKGSTLKLDRLLNEPIELLAEGHVVAQGTLVAIGDQFGLRITAAPKLD
jgi:flagellar motor switch protein FliN/FliY